MYNHIVHAMSVYSIPDYEIQKMRDPTRDQPFKYLFLKSGLCSTPINGRERLKSLLKSFFERIGLELDNILYCQQELLFYFETQLKMDVSCEGDCSKIQKNFEKKEEEDNQLTKELEEIRTKFNSLNGKETYHVSFDLEMQRKKDIDYFQRVETYGQGLYDHYKLRKEKDKKIMVFVISFLDHELESYKVLDRTIDTSKIIQIVPIPNIVVKDGDIVQHVIIQLPKFVESNKDPLKIKERMNNNPFYQWLVILSLRRFERFSQSVEPITLQTIEPLIPLFSQEIQSAFNILEECWFEGMSEDTECSEMLIEIQEIDNDDGRNKTMVQIGRECEQKDDDITMGCEVLNSLFPTF